MVIIIVTDITVRHGVVERAVRGMVCERRKGGFGQFDRRAAWSFGKRSAREDGHFNGRRALPVHFSLLANRCRSSREPLSTWSAVP